MRIGVNATFRMHGGGMMHLRKLLRAWVDHGVPRDHHITIFTRTESLPVLCLPPGNGFEIYPVDFKSLGGHLRPLWEQTAFPGVLKNARLDVVLCPAGIVPLRTVVPTVVIFQNAAPLDDAVNWRTERLTMLANFAVLGRLMRLSARSARRAIFISRFFRDLLIRKHGFPPDKGDLIYCGRDSVPPASRDEALVARLGITGPFILSVSHLYPYKNFSALIRGYGSVFETMKKRGLRMALVGKSVSKRHTAKLNQLIRDMKLDDWVLMPGAVAHDEIGPLMASCEFYVFQSLCENCPAGLLDGLSAGLPTACSNAGVMPEIGGDAVSYFDPRSPADIAKVLVRMAEDASLRTELREKAVIQARTFPTWDEVGRMTLASLERAVAGPQKQQMTAKGVA